MTEHVVKEYLKVVIRRFHELDLDAHTHTYMYMYGCVPTGDIQGLPIMLMLSHHKKTGVLRF